LFVVTKKMSPAGSTEYFLVMPEPSGAGRPVGSPLVTGQVSLPTIPPPGGFVDFPIASGATITSGDLYVGFAAPDPAAGVIFAADSSGSPQRRAYLSTDGGESFRGALGLNVMIRAVVTVPGDQVMELGPGEGPVPIR